jgi:hypothetical protein
MKRLLLTSVAALSVLSASAAHAQTRNNTFDLNKACVGRADNGDCVAMCFSPPNSRAECARWARWVKCAKWNPELPNALTPTTPAEMDAFHRCAQEFGEGEW